MFAWSKYFNDTTTATNALNSILAYQPLIPHWGYNGNARRYWCVYVSGAVMVTNIYRKGQHLRWEVATNRTTDTSLRERAECSASDVRIRIFSL